MSSLVPEMTVTDSPASGRERVEGLEAKMEDKEMDILKDLPSYNSSNFSLLLSPGSTIKSNLVGNINITVLDVVCACGKLSMCMLFCTCSGMLRLT